MDAGEYAGMKARPAFIHNDYKYDNLVLDPENLNNIIAVLDWEMATVGRSADGPGHHSWLLGRGSRQRGAKTI